MKEIQTDAQQSEDIAMYGVYADLLCKTTITFDIHANILSFIGFDYRFLNENGEWNYWFVPRSSMTINNSGKWTGTPYYLSRVFSSNVNEVVKTVRDLLRWVPWFDQVFCLETRGVSLRYTSMVRCKTVPTKVNIRVQSSSISLEVVIGGEKPLFDHLAECRKLVDQDQREEASALFERGPQITPVVGPFSDSKEFVRRVFWNHMLYRFICYDTNKRAVTTQNELQNDPEKAQQEWVEFAESVRKINWDDHYERVFFINYVRARNPFAVKNLTFKSDE